MPSDFIQNLKNKPFSGRGNAVVVGIDIGTTFSGVSYALLYPGQIPKVRPVTKFSDQVVSDNKIPSAIYYDGNGAPKAIGQATALPKVRREADKKRWFKSEHFKMHLRPSGQKLETNGLKLGELPPGKTAEQVMGDFLRYLSQETGKYISNAHGVDTWDQVKDKVIFVLSHPNGWTGYSQQRYRSSAILGGLVPDTDEGRKRIKFITEGEASALACLYGRLGPDTLRPGFRFTIADAGGGTVDVTTFEVTGTSPLRLKECTASDCRFVGSVFVNIRARALLKKRLANSKYDDENIINYLNEEFEKTTKREFTGEDEGLLEIARGAEDEVLGISGGFLTLQQEELAECFDLSVSQTIESISLQLSARGAGRGILPVWLVGGFGYSEYLLKQLRDASKLKGTEIQTPDTNLSKAVANGAVLHYLDDPVVARVCPTTYGTDCLTLFHPLLLELHSMRELFEHAERFPFIGPIFDVIAKKREPIDAGKPFKSSYWRPFLDTGTVHIKKELLCYDGDLPPPFWYEENKDKFKTVFCLEADLSPTDIESTSDSDTDSSGSFPGTPALRKLEFDIEIILGKTEVEARIKWEEDGNVKYGPAKIHWLE